MSTTGIRYKAREGYIKDWRLYLRKQSCEMARESNHLQVQREFEASLAYMRPCFRKQKTKRLGTVVPFYNCSIQETEAESLSSKPA